MDWRILFLTVFLLSQSKSQNNFWSEIGWKAGDVLNQCLSISSNHTQSTTILIKCLQRRSLIMLQKTLNQDVIPIGNGITLITFGNTTKRVPRENNKNENITFDDWQCELWNSVTNVFTTHTIKINMEDDRRQKTSTAEARRLRKNYMPLFMFGIIGLGMVMIPMGFQFLAVLGGKAILLSKMALLLASIQGLKKMATSNIHYGLYQSPAAPSYPWYDRKAEESYPYYPEDYQEYGQDPNYPHVKRISIF